MTHAICIKCGASKFGALNPCKECLYAPDSKEDCARSILLSDHHYSLFELDRIGEALRGGQRVLYDPAEILGYVQAIDAAETEGRTA
jgi:hypothetical protein